MIHSIRARLALWYAGAFALLLGASALAAWLFVARTAAAQADRHLLETAIAVAGAIDAERAEGKADSAAAADVVRELRFPALTVALLDGRSGELLTPGPTATAAARLQAADAPARQALRALLRDVERTRVPDGVATRRTQPRAGADVRLLALPHTVGARRFVVGVAEPQDATAHVLREVALALAAGVPLMLLVATAGGYWLARKSLAPVVAMSEQARRIGAASLHGRLPPGNPRDELGRLAAAFNDLLARLDEAFAQQRRFVADASHELRTPVAVLNGEAELALARDDRPASALRDAIAVMRDEAHRMRRIVDDLFLLARADAGDRALALEELYLADVAADVCRAAQSLARARGVALTLAPADDVGPFADALPFRGDEGLLRRLLLNLVDNAIKHTPSGGTVTIGAARDGDVYRLTVRDGGPGIPPGEWERVFERFYRAPDARAAATARGRARAGSVGDSSSAGLGLPIARWIAEAHAGAVRVAASDAGGTTFEVALPAEPSDAPDAVADAHALGGGA